MIRRLVQRAAIHWQIALIEMRNSLSPFTSIWYWVWFFVHLLLMLVGTYFWVAVYDGRESIAGVGLQQSVNYAVVATVIRQNVAWSMLPIFGARLRNGNLALELLRPADYQLTFYVNETIKMIWTVIREGLPVWLIAWLFLDFRLPPDPAVWGAFAVTLVLGYSVLLCFDWAFGTLAFYTTSYWGIHTLREGIVLFFSGALVPLIMLPDWLQRVAAWLPFGQALYAPVALLAGIIPAEEAPRIWLEQGLWLIGLLALSRLAFRTALRRVAINGG